MYHPKNSFKKTGFSFLRLSHPFFKILKTANQDMTFTQMSMMDAHRIKPLLRVKIHDFIFNISMAWIKLNICHNSPPTFAVHESALKETEKKQATFRTVNRQTYGMLNRATPCNVCWFRASLIRAALLVARVDWEICGSCKRRWRQSSNDAER